MKVQSFSHVGITVSDFSRFVRFYADVFGCPLVGVSDAPPERVRAFFGVGHDHDAPRCKIGWIRVPGGATLEIFRTGLFDLTVAEPLTLSGGTLFGGTDNTWTGTVNLAAPSTINGNSFTITGVINGPTVNEYTVYTRMVVDVNAWPTMGQLIDVVYSPRNPEKWAFSSPVPNPE